MFVSVVSNRQHTGEMEEMGVRVDEYGKLRITSFGKHTFGTYVVGSKPGRNTTYGFAQSSQTSFYNSSRPSTSYQSPSKPSYTQQSYTPAPRTYNSGPSTYTPSPLTYARAPEPKPEPAPTSVFAPTSVVKEEPKREYGAPRVAELKGSPLKLFGSDMEELAENYEIIGKKQYKEELTAPITPTAAVVVFDSFSENKLLRMAWKNKSGYGVTSVSLDLTFRDSCGRLIAKMNNADFKPRGEILPGEIAFAELGLPIPDATCGGKVTVTRVEFSNGLFWSKTVDGVEFEALESKRAYELKNSTFDKVLVSCIELQGLKLDAANHTLEFAVKNIGDAALVSYELLVKASSGSYEENVSRVARNDIRVMPGETGEMHKLTLPSQAIGGTVEVLSGVYENNAMETNLAKFRFGSR